VNTSSNRDARRSGSDRRSRPGTPGPAPGSVRVIKPPLLVVLWQIVPGVLVGLVLAILTVFGPDVWFRPGVLAGIALLGVTLAFVRWWRMQFEVDAHGQVVYRPFLGSRRALTSGAVREVVQFQALHVAGQNATQAATVLVDPAGRRVVYLHGNQWPLTELDALIRPLTGAGAKLTVLAEPSRPRDLPEEYRRILPWGLRHPGLLVTLVLIAALILVAALGLTSL